MIAHSGRMASACNRSQANLESCQHLRACHVSCSPNLPLHVRNTHLLARLLIVVEPLALSQINTREFGTGLRADGFPIALSDGNPTSATNTSHEKPGGALKS